MAGSSVQPGLQCETLSKKKEEEEEEGEEEEKEMTGRGGGELAEVTQAFCRQEDLCMFKPSLVYLANSRSARAAQ